MVEWPVDARNPGEVLACAGLAHLAWREAPEAETGFVRAGDAALRFVAPEVALLRARAGETALESAPEAGSEGLRLAGVTLDWWRPFGLNPALKLWAGQQSAWTVHRSLWTAASDAAPHAWLTHTAPADGRLGLDPTGTWSAQSLGFSVNAHPGLRMGCRPWVGLLASLGLQAVPLPGHRARGGFQYNLWRRAPLALARAAFAGPWSPLHALGRYHVPCARSGANTVLRLATPVAGAHTD